MDLSLSASGFQDDTVTLKASFLYTGTRRSLSDISCPDTAAGAGPGPGQVITAVFFPVRLQKIWSTLQNGKVSIIHPGTRTHLALSITRVSKSGIENQTNQYGEHYYPCEKCMKNGTLESFVYITRTGSCCHSTRNCPGLTRDCNSCKKV